MEFIKIDSENSLMSVTAGELGAIIKILKFVLVDLEFEYETRTGFFENETEALITKLESAISENKISVTDQEVLNLRQNLVEVLFGIGVKDFDAQFNLSLLQEKRRYKISSEEASKLYSAGAAGAKFLQEKHLAGLKRVFLRYFL